MPDEHEAIAAVREALNRIDGSVKDLAKQSSRDNELAIDGRRQMHSRINGIEVQIAKLAERLDPIVVVTAEFREFQVQMAPVLATIVRIVPLVDKHEGAYGEFVRIAPLVDKHEYAYHKGIVFTWIGRAMWGLLLIVTGGLVARMGWRFP